MNNAQKKNFPYDIHNADDLATLKLLDAAGLPNDRRYTLAQIDALRASPMEQLKRGGSSSFLTTRKKLPGSEEREIESVAVVRSTLPKCLTDWLHPDLWLGLEDYLALSDEMMPSQTGSLEPREPGSGEKSDGQEKREKRMKDTWWKARKQMSRLEARMIDAVIRYDAEALIPHRDTFLIKSGASKLCEFFENNSCDF